MSPIIASVTLSAVIAMLSANLQMRSPFTEEQSRAAEQCSGLGWGSGWSQEMLPSLHPLHLGGQRESGRDCVRVRLMVHGQPRCQLTRLEEHTCLCMEDSGQECHRDRGVSAHPKKVLYLTSCTMTERRIACQYRNQHTAGTGDSREGRGLSVHEAGKPADVQDTL